MQLPCFHLVRHIGPTIYCQRFAVCVCLCVFFEDKNLEKHNDSNAAKWMCAFEDQIIQITEAQPSLCEIMGFPSSQLVLGNLPTQVIWSAAHWLRSVWRRSNFSSWDRQSWNHGFRLCWRLQLGMMILWVFVLKKRLWIGILALKSFRTFWLSVAL